MSRRIERARRETERSAGGGSKMPSSVEASDTPVTFEEVRRRLDDPDLILVNALPEVAFEERRIPRSLSLPVADIPTRSRQVLPDPAKEIIVYCGGPT